MDADGCNDVVAAGRTPEEADDEITGETWQWAEHNYVHLDPYVEPAHVLAVRRPGVGA